MKSFLPLAVLALLLMGSCKKLSEATCPEQEEAICDSVCLYHMGDYGSHYWRIPALLCLDDGTLLAVNDKRKYSYKDLPEDIDIVCRRSTDNGVTWSEP